LYLYSPTNLIEDPVVGEDDKNDGVDKSDVSEEEDEEELQRRREEKGKGIADEQFQLTAKRSDTEGRMKIMAGKKETVRQLLRKFHQLSGVSTTTSLVTTNKSHSDCLSRHLDRR
jgi:hypothetical protein